MSPIDRQENFFKKSKQFLLVTAFFVAIIIIEIFIRDIIDEISDEMTIRVQKHYSSSMKKFLEYCTLMGYGLPLSALCVLYFEFSKNKINAIMLIFLTTFNNYFLSIIKMLYSTPRPFMRDEEILAIYKCGKEFGNPSGHALNGLFFYYIMLNSIRKRCIEIIEQKYSLQKCHLHNDSMKISVQKKKNIYDESNAKIEVKEENITINNDPSLTPKKKEECKHCKKIKNTFLSPKEESHCEGCRKKDNLKITSFLSSENPKMSSINIATPPVVVVCSPKPIYKIYLQLIGVNLFFRGLTFTLILFIGYSRIYFGLHSIIQVIFGWIYGIYFLFAFYMIFTDEYTQFNILLLFERLSSAHTQIKTRKKLILWNTIAYILAFLIPWIIFYAYQSTFDVPSTWRNNIKKKCYTDMHNETFFYENCFSDVGSISLIFGGIYGIAFSKANYKHLKFWKNYTKCSFYAKLFRLVFYALISGLIYGIFILFPVEDQVYLNCLLENNLKAGLVGFLIIYLVPKIFSYFKLDVTGDFMKEKV